MSGFADKPTVIEGPADGSFWPKSDIETANWLFVCT
jgi:hypothetical protein